MPKKKTRSSINVSPKVWDAVFDRKLALELTTRKNIGMGKAIEDLLMIRNLAEFTHWFELNYQKLGFIEVEKSTPVFIPIYTMNMDGKTVSVLLLLCTSDFPDTLREANSIDYVICLEEDMKIPFPTIVVDFIEFQKKIPYIFYISKEINVKLRKYRKFDWAKLLQETVKEKIRELDMKNEV